ncbi:MAG TPA: isoprenylcysteine carboxylmethyltransferase family protein, partial [Methylomirabilota bacterium]
YRRKSDLAGGTISRAVEPAWIRASLSLAGLCLLGGLLAYIVYPRLLAWSMVQVPETVRWAGVALATTTVVTTAWVFRSLGLNVSPTVVSRAGATLVTRGPYRFIRHPLYANGAVTFLAYSLISGSWWFVAVLLAGAIPLAVRTRTEEAHLERRFGEAWRAYASRTGRFFPRIGRSRRKMSPVSPAAAD